MDVWEGPKYTLTLRVFWPYDGLKSAAVNVTKKVYESTTGYNDISIFYCFYFLSTFFFKARYYHNYISYWLREIIKINLSNVNPVSSQVTENSHVFVDFSCLTWRIDQYRITKQLLI